MGRQALLCGERSRARQAGARRQTGQPTCEDFPSRCVGALAPLSGIILKQDQVLLMSGTDLRDCFYQFVASPQRTERNHLRCRLTPAEARRVFGFDCAEFLQPDGAVVCGLSSLAMGDSSASLSAATSVYCSFTAEPSIPMSFLCKPRLTVPWP